MEACLPNQFIVAVTQFLKTASTGSGIKITHVVVTVPHACRPFEFRSSLSQILQKFHRRMHVCNVCRF